MDAATKAVTMKNNVGKVFVVLTTFLSIAFLGFSFAARISGTNWEGEAESLDKYFVEKNVNEKETTYTLKDKINQESIKANAKLIPEVLVAAYNHESTQLNEKIQALEPLPEQIKKRQDEILAQQKVDLKAMEAREAELKQTFEKVTKAIQDLSVEGNKVALEARTIWDEAELRREDVARLRNLLEELEVDQFQSLEQKKRLQDELSRMKGVLARLQRRNVQLKSSYEE
jgi:chromosome segregation ATPase